MKTDDGRLIIVSGKSRSGKTVYVERRTRTERRIFAWDPEDQWSQVRGFRRVSSRADLLAMADKGGAMKIAFVPSGHLAQDFDFFCACAFHWGRFAGGGVVIAEEIADVSSPAKAPGHWGILLRRGLKRGLSIYAISQRWAEADKTAFGNASEFVCFMAASFDDVAYLTRKTRIDGAILEGLRPLEWVRYEPGQPIERGKIRF